MTDRQQDSSAAAGHVGPPPRVGRALLISSGLAALVAIYAALGFWLVPHLIEQRVAPELAQRYGVRLAVADVRFNPFTFVAHAHGVVLHGADGASLLRADSLVMDYAPSALLLHRIWKLDRVALTGLHLDLLLREDGQLNLLAPSRAASSRAAAPAGDPPRILIDLLEVSDASMVFTSRQGSEPAQVSIAPITVRVQGLSTVAGKAARHEFSAAMADGSTLQAQGELALWPTLVASGQFKLAALQASTVLPFLRSALHADQLQGKVDLSAHYAYAVVSGLRLDRVDMQVADLLLNAPGTAKPLLVLARVQATGGTIDLNKRDMALTMLGLSRGKLALTTGPDGRLAWQRLLPAPAQSADPAARRPGWKIAVADLRMDGVGLDYEDQQRQPALRASVGSIDGALRLTVAEGQPNVTGSDITLAARDISMPAASPGGPSLHVTSVGVTSGSFDLSSKRVAADALSFDGGSLAIGRDADGTIDWRRRFAPLTSPALASARWNYDIARVDVRGVDVALADRSQQPVFKYGLRINAASGQQISSQGETPARFDVQLVAAQGGTLEARGSVSAGGPGAQASVRVSKLELAPFRPLVQRYTGFDLRAGPLTLEGRLRNESGWDIDQMNVDLPGVTLRRGAAGEVLLSAARLQLQDGRVAPSQRQVTVGQLAVAQGAVRARLLPNGRLDWQAPAVRSAPAPVAGARPAPWTVRIDALKVQEMAAQFADVRGKAPLQLKLARVDLAAALQLTVGGARTQIVAQGVQAQARGVAVSANHRAAPVLAVDTISLASGRFDLTGRRVGAARLAFAGGSAQVVRDASGQLRLPELFAARPVDSGPAAATRARADAPWNYALDTVEVQGFAIDAQDHGYQPPMALEARLDASIKHLYTGEQAALEATLVLSGGAGSIQASGAVTPSTGGVQARLRAESLALAPLQPLLTRYTTIVLKSGRAAGDLEVTYTPRSSDAVKAQGQVSLTGVTLNEADTGAHVLTLDRLHAKKLEFASAARRLRISEIELVQPDARIAIAKDRTFNLGELFRPQAVEGTAGPQKQELDEPESAPAFDLAVQSIRIRDGSVDFSDQSLVLPFATQVTEIDATIAGVSSDRSRRAEVQAKGSVQTYGSASVNGSIAPFDPRRYTDLQVRFNNVLVQPLSPYTATFAGRKVQTGKLWLDLDYKIDQGALLGKNDIRLADFKLGERVESPSAIDFPLNLAVSLLTDAKGEIKLSVPVRGDVDNPHFKVGDAIAQAVGNAISRIVTAPFRLLGRLFGRESDALASIDFAPGSFTLAPEQREKLDTLTQALHERPLLSLVVGAPYDAQADTLALRRNETRRQIARQLGDKDAGEEAAGAPVLVAFDDPATRKALRALLAQQGGPGAAAGASVNDDRAAYEAMFERIASAQALGAGAPQILATRRAREIAQYLTQQGIDRARVQTGQVLAVDAGSDGMVDAALTVAPASAAP